MCRKMQQQSETEDNRVLRQDVENKVKHQTSKSSRVHEQIVSDCTV
jgi:hypothetical protein